MRKVLVSIVLALILKMCKHFAQLEKCLLSENIGAIANKIRLMKQKN